MEKRVAIIGAGISGLLTCKYAASRGFNPVVFEAEEQVGGLWNHTIESTRLQNIKDFFQFSDFPWPSSVRDPLPTNAQLLEYLQSYARHFELLPYINFNSKFISVSYVGECEEEMQSWELGGGSGKAFGSKGKWNLKVLHTKEESVKEYAVEFVVICIGRFSGLPEIPSFPPGYGPEVFSGKVLHSMEYSAMDNASAAEFIKGKRIAIIGSGKSAVDIAFECAKVNGNDIPCTVIQRTIHWMLPQDAQPWGLSLGFLCFSRFAELLVHKPGEAFLSSILATSLSPLRWGMSKLIESYLRWRLPLKKYNMIPKESVLQDMSSCQALFLPPNFYDKVEDRSIVLKKSQCFSFCKEGLILDGEDDHIKDLRPLQFLSTGEVLKYMSSLTNDPSKDSTASGDKLLGVFSNLYTFEMRCKWLGYFLDEAFKLPSIKEMEEDIKWEKYMKKYSSNGKFRRACISGVTIWYNDQLCKDIGCNPRRKKGFFMDLFEPYGLADYKEL
ncbi:UNVERIFIED_CONTAM: putative flavin-containing monooxygenase 1 [Sesamum latifolium]|uniref:Flavin-containing monooxygenase n=1 Tax=Sesamum latifolium TaxID=2727402 RepID=A0AAW2VDZ4_9LAMI